MSLYLKNLTLLWFCSLFLPFRKKQIGIPIKMVALVSAALVHWLLQTALRPLREECSTVLFLLVDYLVVFSLYRGHPMKRLLLILTHSIFVICCQNIAFFLCAVSLRASKQSVYPCKPFLLACYGGLLLALTFCSLFAHRLQPDNPASISTKGWLFLLSMPIISHVMLTVLSHAFLSEWDSPVLNNALFGVSLGLLAFNLLHFLVSRNVVERAEVLRVQNQRLRYRHAYYLEELEHLARHQNAANRLIGSFEQDFHVVGKLLEQGELISAARYMEQMTGNVSQVGSIIYSGNRHIDMILNNELPRLEKLGISCHIQPAALGELSFHVSDLHRLLVNALHNACEACVRQGLSGTLIDISFATQGNFFMFSISNPVDDSYAKEPIDKPRKNEDGHGYGLKLIRTVADKYQGHTSYSVRDGRFHLCVILQEPAHMESPPPQIHGKAQGTTKKRPDTVSRG